MIIFIEFHDSFLICDDKNHELMMFFILSGCVHMSVISQVLCIVDENGIIRHVKGNERDVFQSSTDILHEGNAISSIPWHTVFFQPLRQDLSFQSLHTKNGEDVFFHRYPFNGLPNNKDGSIYVFTSFHTEDKTDFSTSLIFKSPSMRKIMAIIQNVSQVDSTVLLLGESGVGKTAIAKLIHEKSSRKNGPFISVNCGSLPENLIESELFGYEAGTFTGGNNKGKKGLFESAENGSILLDEIAELPFFMQSKLLDVVQENKIRKVGGIREKTINVRIMAATNKNLPKLVDNGEFREDLYYRLNVVPLYIPPLRNRKEDIPDMIENFLAMFNQKYGRARTLSNEKKETFINYHWPGNIRELANQMERLVVTNDAPEYENGVAIRAEKSIASLGDAEDVTAHKAAFPLLKEAKAQVEKELILKAYNVYKNTYKTAKALGVDQSTISKKITKYKNEQSL